VGDRRTDEIEALMHSTVHGLVHKAGRPAAIEALKHYFSTLPVGDLQTMKPADVASLAGDYLRQHGPSLQLAMREPSVEKRSSLEDLQELSAKGWIDGF